MVADFCYNTNHFRLWCLKNDQIQKVTTIQFFLLIFILFAITRVILRLREKVLSTQAAFFWLVIWLAAAAMILLPTTATRIASLLGVGRGVDVILYISLALLFYLVFRGYVMIEDLRHDITTLVRQLAITSPQNNPKKRKKKR